MNLLHPDDYALMYGPFIVTARNAQACIDAGNKGDMVARRVMSGINGWLVQAYENKNAGCVCHDCPTLRQMFSPQHQPAAFLVMLPLREEDKWGLIVAVCDHCAHHHAGDLQQEMEQALRKQYPSLTMEPRTLH